METMVYGNIVWVIYSNRDKVIVIMLALYKTIVSRRDPWIGNSHCGNICRVYVDLVLTYSHSISDNGKSFEQPDHCLCPWNVVIDVAHLLKLFYNYLRWRYYSWRGSNIPLETKLKRVAMQRMANKHCMFILTYCIESWVFSLL